MSTDTIEVCNNAGVSELLLQQRQGVVLEVGGLLPSVHAVSVQCSSPDVGYLCNT